MNPEKKLDFLRKALSIDSSESAGTAEYVQFLVDIAQKMGLRSDTKTYTLKDVDYHNLFISHGLDLKDDAELEYLFVNPLDTENPGPFRAWSEMAEDPFDSMVKGSRLYGLGATSGKLNTFLQLKALETVSEDQKKRVGILGTYGRSLRSYGVLKFLRESRLKIKNIVIGFPTNNKIVSTQAGRFKVRISLPFSESEREARQKHDEIENSSSQSQYFSSKPRDEKEGNRVEWQGNTIVQSFEFLNNLPEQIVILDLEGGKDTSSEPRSTLLEFDLASGIKDPMSLKLKKLYECLAELNQEFAKATNFDFEPANPQINFGRIKCDYDQIEIYGECVFPPGITTDISEDWIGGLRVNIQELGGETKVLSQRFPYTFEGDSEFLQETLRLCGMDKAKSLAYTTEADLFKLAGYNPLIYGPGVFESLFLPNESVELADLDEAENFYYKLITSNKGEGFENHKL